MVHIRAPAKGRKKNRKVMVHIRAPANGRKKNRSDGAHTCACQWAKKKKTKREVMVHIRAPAKGQKKIIIMQNEPPVSTSTASATSPKEEPHREEGAGREAIGATETGTFISNTQKKQEKKKRKKKLDSECQLHR